MAPLTIVTLDFISRIQDFVLVRPTEGLQPTLTPCGSEMADPSKLLRIGNKETPGSCLHGSVVFQCTILMNHIKIHFKVMLNTLKNIYSCSICYATCYSSPSSMLQFPSRKASKGRTGGRLEMSHTFSASSNSSELP